MLTVFIIAPIPLSGCYSTNVAKDTVISKSYTLCTIRNSDAISTTPQFLIGTDSGTVTVVSSVSIPINQWHLYIGTYDGIDAKLYVDGVLVGTTNDPGNIQLDASDILIAKNSFGGYGQGLIGDTVLYSNTISVISLYESTKWKYQDTVTENFHYQYLDGASVPDNANDYYLFENNSMSYCDNMTISVNGVQRLYYNPNDIIVSTGTTGTLPDRVGANDGTIYWGENPAGIAVTLGSMSASTQPTISDFEEETPRDVLPIAPVSDWYGDGTISKASTLASPFRTAVTVVSDNTTLSEIQVWRFYGLVIWLFVTVAAGFSLRGHLGITMMVSGATLGGLVAFDYNIFPLWLLVITIGCFIGGFIAERSPSL